MDSEGFFTIMKIKYVYKRKGGLMIGPSFLGMNDKFAKMVFPEYSYFLLRDIGMTGSAYILFIAGVKIDIRLLLKVQRKELSTALCGIFLPYITIMFISFLLRHYLPMDNHNHWPYSVAHVVSSTRIADLHPILNELNLLNSDLGKLAMSLTLINDTILWFADIIQGFFLAVGIDHWMGVRYFFTIISILIILIFVIHPAMLWIIKNTREGRSVDQKYIVAILVGVLVMAFISNMIGAPCVIVPFCFGLAIPDGPPLGAAIVEKSEFIFQQLLMPALYAIIGMNTNVFDVEDFVRWEIFSFVLIMAYIGKLLGTLLPCLIFKMPFRDALVLGFIMNFKGISTLIRLIYLKFKKKLDFELFELMLVLALMGTAIATSVVRYLHAPIRTSNPNSRRTIQHTEPNTELRILTCTHSEDNVPAIIGVLEVSNATQNNPICVYVLHLLELIGRANPMLVGHDDYRRFSNPNTTDRIINAFKNYEKCNDGRVSVQPFISMSPYITMHKDICAFASDKNVSLIILPFHKQVTYVGEVVDNALQIVNPNILVEAPCSVGVIVDRGLSRTKWAFSYHFLYNIGVFFLGGADDREALAYAVRMAEHPSIRINVVRMLPLDDERDNKIEREMDDDLISGFRQRNMSNYHIVYIEKFLKDETEMFTEIRSMEGIYDLLIVGRRHESSSILKEELTAWTENPQLGVVGDILASLDFQGMPSVLVMQQYIEQNSYVNPI